MTTLPTWAARGQHARPGPVVGRRSRQFGRMRGEADRVGAEGRLPDVLLVAAVAGPVVLRAAQHIVGRAIGQDVHFLARVAAQIPFQRPRQQGQRTRPPQPAQQLAIGLERREEGVVPPAECIEHPHDQAYRARVQIGLQGQVGHAVLEARCTQAPAPGLGQADAHALPVFQGGAARLASVSLASVSLASVAAIAAMAGGRR